MAVLTFERGDSARPVGHAFLYFGSGDEVFATYVVVPPILFDIAKYIPPAFASSLGAFGMVGANTSCLPIPPVPERLSIGEVRRLAEWRGDDVVVDRFVMSDDPTALAARAFELAETYATAFREAIDRAPLPEARAFNQADGGDGLALLYSVLSENERIAEIARRLGTLRYALEVSDAALVESTCAEMRAIGAYLPASYRTDELIAAARRPDPDGARLAQLYVERGYKLASSDEEGVPALDAEIESLERNHA